MRDIIVLSNYLILPEVIPHPTCPQWLLWECLVTCHSPLLHTWDTVTRPSHSLSSSLSMTWWIGVTKTLCPHIYEVCVHLPLIYLSPQIDISHSCPISVNHSPFCTSPQYQSRDYQFSSLSVSTIYTGSHTRRNQCSSCFFFACSLTLISLLIKLSQAFRLTSIIFFCNCQHM